ncbi:hypothetical protein, partial [Thiolapillus sp.]|uniref:hypothetical protein n=1 Tax=Thiolapillus sp. TaxID=2017437 RepID=UPI003AF811BD
FNAFFNDQYSTRIFGQLGKTQYKWRTAPAVLERFFKQISKLEFRVSEEKNQHTFTTSSQGGHFE